MRILHVLAALDGGGVEVLLKNYYAHMDRDRFSFDFIVHGERKGRLEDWFIQQGCGIYHVPPKGRNLAANLMRMKRAIRWGNYDVIHTHQGVMSAFPLMFARECGIPMRIAHSHVAAVEKRKPMEWWLRREVLEAATHYMACSEEAAEWLFGQEIAGTNSCMILPNAINLKEFSWNPKERERIRRDLALEGHFVIGTVARFTEQKNHKFLIEIGKRILERRPDAIFLLVGDGPLKERVWRQAKAFGMEGQVRFMGNRDDVGALMQAMDCFLLPSIYEGFGIVLLEAQASGLTCFTSAGVVPNGANVTGQVHYLDLNAGADTWAGEILKTYYPKRKDMTEQIAQAGYDIVREAKRLEQYYAQRRKGEEG